MTEVFKVEVTPNLVKRKEQEWNGRDSDELCGWDTVTKTVQAGWKWRLYKTTYDWKETELKFKEELNKVEALKRDLNFEFKMNFQIPYSVEVSLNDKDFILIETLIIEDEIFEEEVFFFQKRVGMSTNYLFGKKPLLSAPVKANNREGSTVRGYAASLIIDNELQKEEEFYLSVLKDFQSAI